MHFNPTITLGDILYIVGLVFMLGMAWTRIKAVEIQIIDLRKDHQIVQQAIMTLTGHVQRVIGAFEMHVRTKD